MKATPPSPGDHASRERPTALAGLVRRREIWWPTWRGCVLLLGTVTLLGAIILLGAYHFLAPIAPRPSGVLAVEGWLDRDDLDHVTRELRSGRYSGFYTTGTPIEEDSPLAIYGTYAEYAAQRLRKSGVADVVSVPAPETKRDRTYACAVALRDWLNVHGGVPRDLTLLTHGPHARRSRLLFQKAFGDSVQIGVIGFPADDYDPDRWWLYSQGFREVTGEMIAYLYARLLFWRHGD